jgi:hypothetical protein
MRISRTMAGALAVPLVAAMLGGLGSARAATSACQGRAGAQPPSPGDQNKLNGVAVLSACDAWAVGSFRDVHGVQDTLIEHWNGSDWSVVPSPSPGTQINFLQSVRAASPVSIWAVGEYESGGSAKSLVLHWDGARWTQQDAPSPGTSFSELSGIRAVPGGGAWAVGAFASGTSQRALILHFTGGRWHRVSGPRVGTGESLSGVTATSAKDVWAVGASFKEPAAGRLAAGRLAPGVPAAAQAVRTLILHWNGRTWTTVASPSPGALAELEAVGAGSSSRALAIGVEELASGHFRTLTLRWDGRNWTRVSSPNPGGSSADDFLRGITVLSDGTAFAVGGTIPSSGQQSALVEKWNGSRWTTVAIHRPSGANGLGGIASASASSIWAVGTRQGPTTSLAFALHCC